MNSLFTQKNFTFHFSTRAPIRERLYKINFWVLITQKRAPRFGGKCSTIFCWKVLILIEKFASGRCASCAALFRRESSGSTLNWKIEKRSDWSRSRSWYWMMRSQTSPTFKISDVDDLAISRVDLSCLSSNFGGLTINDVTHFGVTSLWRGSLEYFTMDSRFCSWFAVVD